MLVYRIERKKYLANTLEGIGAALTKGFRWNSLNTYLVYTSESRALATLEISVHLDLSENLPIDRFYVGIYISDDITILEVDINDLPRNWDSKPPTKTTQFIGDDFVQSNEAAVLKVPSCVVPLESNYLINPNHKDAKRIEIVSTTPVKFDSRLKAYKEK